MPTDRRWVKQDLGAAERGQPRRFRIPLVPANADPNLPVLRGPRLEPEIARREVKLLVVGRIVRDMHLAILPEVLAVRIDDRGGIVVNARCAFFEKGGDDYRFC